MLETPLFKFLAKEQPEDFAFMYLWALLNKSQNPSLVEIEPAKKQLEDAIELIRHDHDTMVALAHHTVALAYAAEARQSESNADFLVGEAIKHQKIAAERMPKHQLFLQAELDEHMVEFLEKGGRPDETRRFLKQANLWRKKLVPAANIYQVDSRTRLAKHIIDHADNKSDFKEAEDLLMAQRSEVENRPSDDVFRSRWLAQVINLYDSWQRPAELEKWKAVLR
jgi:hypothetical protein